MLYWSKSTFSARSKNSALQAGASRAAARTGIDPSTTASADPALTEWSGQIRATRNVRSQTGSCRAWNASLNITHCFACTQAMEAVPDRERHVPVVSAEEFVASSAIEHDLDICRPTSFINMSCTMTAGLKKGASELRATRSGVLRSRLRWPESLVNTDFDEPA